MKLPATGLIESTCEHIGLSSSTRDDPRLVSALEQYQNEWKAGIAPCRETFLARYPEIASELGDCLDGLLLLQSGPFPWSTPSKPDGKAPWAQLGDYRILREVGRGGMGVVYEALQVSLDRRVALKVLPPAASNESRQRFQVEAQAAAHLHHPHIVPIFSVGTDLGVDYYAMQFIEGRTLSGIIDDLRRQNDSTQVYVKSTKATKTTNTPGTQTLPPSDATPGKGSSTSTLTSLSDPSHRGRPFFRSVARLGLQAAEALDHAHALGVLHRDVKPSNLMVDLYGDLWVTDFGLARFRDDVSLTQTGDIVGTLRYMSPEQALGRRVLIDQRVDLYSLGATLYELATLKPVFDGHDRQELLAKISVEEPIPPRKVNAAIPRDLETILLKAMSKDVGKRYTTARDLADDLRRFLDDHPIKARRPTALDHTAKWARRHRTSLSAMLIAFVAATSVGSVLLWRERQQTLHALDELKEGRKRERDAMRFVFRVSDGIMMQAMSTLAASDPSKGDEPDGFYRNALGAYQQIAEQYRSSPDMRMIAADAYRRVGFVLMILRYVKSTQPFLNADAEGAYRHSLALCEDEIQANPTAVDPRRMKATVLMELADMLRSIRGFQAAEPLFREAESIRRSLVEGPHRTQQLLEEWSYNQFRWCEILLTAGHYAEAERTFRESTKLSPNPLATELRWGVLLSMTGRHKEAKQAFETVLQQSPENPEALNDLAWLLASRPNSPVHAPARAVELAEKAVQKAPDVASYWNTLGMARYRMERWDDAKAALEKSMQLHEPDATDWLILAMIDHKRGKTAEAQRRYTQACSWMKGRNIQEPDFLAMRDEASKLLGEKGASTLPGTP